MLTTRLLVAVFVLIAAAVPVVVGAVSSPVQGAPDPAAALAAQQQAMKKLAYLDGQWRGSASTVLPSGEKHEITQTERCGPLLDGSIRLIEGRGYDADGATAFNAFGVLSFDPATKSYSMRSYAQGHVGDFAVTPSSNGLAWEIPAGPMTIRYTLTVDGDTWHEVGERLATGKEPIRFFEMTLKRIGDTNWPAGAPVGMK